MRKVTITFEYDESFLDNPTIAEDKHFFRTQIDSYVEETAENTHVEIIQLP
jgi:hypothetical protein